jgi:hypothetical protein
MTPNTINIEQKLSQLSAITNSDLTAIGFVERDTRKIRWNAVVGSISKRTEKIRQHEQVGLTGEVLRTGSFMQFRNEDVYVRPTDEAIMLTEKLSHAAAWPLAACNGKYWVAILIGKRQHGVYEPEQIQAGTKLVEELIAQYKMTTIIAGVKA